MLELKSVYPLPPLTPCSAGAQESEGHGRAAMSQCHKGVSCSELNFQFLLAFPICPQSEFFNRCHLHDRVNQRVKCSRDWSQWVTGKAALLGQKRDGADAVSATPCTNGLYEDTWIQGWIRTL